MTGPRSLVRRATLAVALLLAWLPLDTAAGPARASQAPPAGVGAPAAFLVRHAEKDIAVADDPPLTELGRRRAEALAERLAGESIARILTTDTRRARDTAAPLAGRLGLVPEVYDPKRLDELAAELKRRSEPVLVVGHSNTTDRLAVALGGDGGDPIGDDEYDRLYRVDLASGATSIERFAPLAGK